MSTFTLLHFFSLPRPHSTSLVSFCIIPCICWAKLCFALIDSESFFSNLLPIFGPDLLLRDRFSVKTVICLQASHTWGSAHFSQDLPCCQLVTTLSERERAFLFFSLSLSLSSISTSASQCCFLSSFVFSLLYPLREWSVCVDLRGASSFSGPHLSAFTVPTFSRAGFIVKLGPVKTLPCTTMCANDGAWRLACVSNMERLLNCFWHLGCFVSVCICEEDRKLKNICQLWNGQVILVIFLHKTFPANYFILCTDKWTLLPQHTYTKIPIISTSTCH